MAILTGNLPPADAYAEHLDAYGQTMADGLKDGTLGTGKPLLARTGR